MQLNQFKNIARNIGSLLSAEGVKVAHSQMLEIVAKSMGFRSYNGCKASLENLESEKPYQENILVFNTNRNEFEKLWSLRNERAFVPPFMNVHIEYGENKQIVMLSGSNTQFVLDELKNSTDYCLEHGIKATMTVRSCEQVDFLHMQYLEEKATESLNSKRKLTPEEAVKVLGFDVEKFKL